MASGSTSQERKNIPIFSITEKILIEIFNRLLYSDREITSQWSWVAVTHVCRNWRLIALSQPGLWTRIPITHSLARLEASIARSLSEPLTIDTNIAVHQNCTRCLHCILKALEYLPRVQKFSLKACLPPDIWTKLLQIFLDSPTPLLEAFHLVAPPYEVGSTPLRLSDSFLTKEAPKLRSVTFVHCILPWLSPMMNNLVELTIDLIYYPYEGYMGPTIDAIIQLLKRCPGLENLTLSGVPKNTQNTEPESADTQMVAELPHLSKITLHGLEFKICSKLINSIVAPSNAVWFVACSGKFTHQSNLDICHAINRGKMCKIAKVIRDARYTYLIFLNEDEELQSSFRLPFDENAAPTQNYQMFIDTLVTIINEDCEGEGLWSTIKEFRLEHYNDIPIHFDEFIDVMNSMPWMQRMHVKFIKETYHANEDAGTIIGLSQVLLPQAEYDEDDFNELMEDEEYQGLGAEERSKIHDDMLDPLIDICHALRVIHFTNAKFINYSQVDAAKEFLECMEMRHKLGLQFRLVTFSSCAGLTNDWLNELSRCVVRVEVDGTPWVKRDE